ncbi:MAG: hypothetical protein SGJ10_14050 [Bacteroidota bacterium]|nr:hypothetical protein [Bacteroidota bacterium]
MKKKIYITLIILLVIVFLTYFFSPFKGNDIYKHKAIVSTMEIKAPISKVFTYLSNSSNATKWSVYVHHITTLNSQEVVDGKIGCRRRCFQQADEQGVVWDELITEVIPEQKRQLVLYNMHGFSMQAEGLATEQLYTKVTDSTTSVSLTLFYKTGEASTIETMKTYFAAYFIYNIFNRNLANIKTNCEQL